jgi:hypothetical protein
LRIVNRPSGWSTTVTRLPIAALACSLGSACQRVRSSDKIQQVDQGAIVQNKRLGVALAFIREEQLRRGPERRKGTTPARSARRTSV